MPTAPSTIVSTNLQLEIDRIDLALALHPDLVDKWLNAGPGAADDPGTGQADGATVGPDAADAHENVVDAGPADIQYGALPDALQSLLSGLHPGADGKVDVSALNTYLAAHAAQTHDLVAMIDRFDTNDNHPGSGDGAHSDGMHDAVDEVNDAPPDAFGDTPISLVGVPSIQLAA